MSEFLLKRCRVPNLGDSMNDYLINYIAGKRIPVISQYYANPEKKPILIAIGSILQWADNNTVIWGAGFISRESRLKVRPLKICAVRGPLSRTMVISQDIYCPKVYGDPALLYPRYYKPKVKKKYKLGIVAHYIDRHSPLMKRLQGKSVLDIFVKGSVNAVVDQINSCEYIASSSLHGLIVADAYNIPSLWIKITDKVIGRGFKFQDYFASVGRKDEGPLVIDKKTTIKDILRSFKPYEINIDLDRLLECCPVKK